MATPPREAIGLTTSKTFERFAGLSAVLVGIGSVAYSAAFVLAVRADSRAAVVVTAVLLLLGGLLTMPVMVALHQRLRAADQGFALWALLLGVLGSLGSAIHGGFGLAKIVGPPTLPTEIPNPVDPRGLLTFGVVGLALVVFAALIRQGGGLPRALGWVGAATGVLLVLVYLGRLILFDPNNPVLLGVAALTGVIANPVFFIWLGVVLRRA